MADDRIRPSADASEKAAPAFKFEDRRHSARPSENENGAADAEVSTRPTVIDEYRRRAETAEQQLKEYIAAYKNAEAEHEKVRERWSRDIERRVALRFGTLVEELLELVDDLERALEHAGPQAGPLAQGVSMARDRFLAALERNGVEPIEIDGAAFDPAVAEALHLEPVEDPSRDGVVTRTLRRGYRMGDHVIRPARVAVGRHEP